MSPPVPVYQGVIRYRSDRRAFSGTALKPSRPFRGSLSMRPSDSSRAIVCLPRDAVTASPARLRPSEIPAFTASALQSTTKCPCIRTLPTTAPFRSLRPTGVRVDPAAHPGRSSRTPQAWASPIGLVFWGSTAARRRCLGRHAPMGIACSSWTRVCGTRRSNATR